MNRKKRQFPKALSERIRPIPIELGEFIGLHLALSEFLGKDPDPRITQRYQSHVDRIERSRRTKMEMLFRHYGLVTGDWQGLAMAMANDFVPGMQTAKARPGAKTIWNPFTVAILRVQIDKVQAMKPGRTFADAARIVARMPPWKRLASGNNGWETLRRRAYTAYPGFVRALVDAQIEYVEGPNPERTQDVTELAAKHFTKQRLS